MKVFGHQRQRLDDAGSSRVSSEPAFLILGMARSGTSLVQRIACELPGVRVPVETQFLRFLTKRRVWKRFPLDRHGLENILRDFIVEESSRDMLLDQSQVIDHLGGSCSRPIQLFGAIVRCLAGKADIYGEKSPQHLLYWRMLTRALPDLKLVAVVRDPRSVITSRLDLPWESKHPFAYVFLADQWAFEQRQLLTAFRRLGSRRMVILRYEDVVADPDAARAAIARLLGVVVDAPTEEMIPDDLNMILPWEYWKENVLGPITTDRIANWQRLGDRRAFDVAAACRRMMIHFGYTDVPTRARATAHALQYPRSIQFRRIRAKLGRYRRVRRLNRIRV